MVDQSNLRAAIQDAGQRPETVSSSVSTIKQAGVNLARTMMTIMAVTLLVLLIVLALWEDQSRIAGEKANEREAAVIATATLQRPDPQLRALAAALRVTADRPATLLPANTTILLDGVQRSGAASGEQVKAIDVCKTPLPSPAARVASLVACADVLDALSGADAAAAQKIAMLGKLREAAAAERAASRAYWLQIAQLLLINLLLPILTALLGYIFGTQQAEG